MYALLMFSNSLKMFDFVLAVYLIIISDKNLQLSAQPLCT